MRCTRITRQHRRSFVLYSHDAFADGTSPRWGSADPEASTVDGCPNPPGDTADGCVVYGRLSRITIDTATMRGAEQPLLGSNWCQQYPSHSIGDLVFGSDGYLYLSAGDGASFNFADFGQDGSPVNPCGDPPVPVGTVNDGPNAEGGSLRSQDVLTSSDPTSYDGALLRIDVSTTPVTAPATNPLIGNSRADDDFIVAVGLRNPFRINRRPGTSEIWIADVGWGTWEELNRVQTPGGPVQNFGWPCFEGGYPQSERLGSFQNQTLCKQLYDGPLPANMQLRSAHYAYRHDAQVVPGERCGSGSSSITGITFNAGNAYPANYKNAAFFADSSRRCVWTMFAGANGEPDPAQRAPLVSVASGRIVDIQMGPDQKLYYVDLDGGNIYRIDHFALNEPPVAQVSATPTNGLASLTVSFDASASRDAEDGAALTFAWDLDADGAFDDATSATTSFTYTRAGSVVARVRSSDSKGATAVASVTITAGNTAPQPYITTPTSTLAWTVGSQVQFSGGANDAQDGALPPSALSWELVLHHCFTLDDCHTHAITTAEGVASGSFTAPDHEYPSFLKVRLRATDLPPAGWYDTAWKRRMLLQIDGAALSETLTDVPVLVRLTPSRFTYADAQAGGRDLRFVSETGAVLAHEIESWDPTGESTIWVKVPSIAAGSGARVHLYYGNPTAPDGQDVDGVFTNGYAAAWHLGPSLVDSSPNGNTGTNVGAVGVAGRIGNGFKFDGATYLDMGTKPILNLPPTFAIEAWVKIDDPNRAGSPRVLSKKGNWDAPAGYNLEYKPADNNVTTVGSGPDYLRAEGVDLDTGWHHLVTAGADGSGEVFVDGVARTTDGTLSPLLPSNEHLDIGRAAGGDYFLGAIDEVRLSTVRRSAAWIALQHRSMTDALLTYGATETPTTLSSTVGVELQPRTVRVSFASDPSGASVSVGPYTGTTPFDVTLIVGSASSVSISSPQVVGGVTYAFSSWSDGGAASHGFTVPAAPVTLTARLSPAANQLPLVTFSNPQGGSSLVGPVVPVAISATDPEGRGITRVDLLVDDVLVGSDTSAPYEFAWNAALGAHSLVARAVDVDGGQGQSATVNVTIGISPTQDTDGDGMPDLWELDHGLDPAAAADGASDRDGDGLSNANEYTRGTNIDDTDSDDDTWADGFEVTFGSDPLSAGSAPPPPTATIASPTAEASIVGASVPISVALSGTTRTGDHLHVQLDGEKVVMLFGATATHTFEGVTPGSHTLVLEVASGAHGSYFTLDPVRYAASRTSVTFTTAAVPDPVGTGLQGAYYDNIDFTNLLLTRTDATVGFDWGSGSPAAAIAADTFSVRWTGRVKPRHSQTYTFTTRSDDGVRLWVDGQALIDNWTDHGPTNNSATITLVADRLYDVRMDFYERGGGAVAQLSWQSSSQALEIIPTARLYPPAPVACTSDTGCAATEHCANAVCTAKKPDGAACTAANQCVGGVCTSSVCSGPVGTGLEGAYYDNRDFTALFSTRTDARVSFDWGNGAPVSGMGVDDFSVRWTGKVRPRFSETYTFYTRSDDGVRLSVNGTQIINNWTDHAPTTNSGTITLTAGVMYNVQLEFYERGGGALMTLEWQSPSQAREVVPQERLYGP